MMSWFSVTCSSLLLTAAICGTQVKAQAEWGYSGNIAPTSWPNSYPACGRSNQSPINFDTLTIPEDSTLGHIEFIDYDESPPNNQWQLLNNGQTVMLRADYPCPPQIQGASLHAKYQLLQIHFHWSNVDYRGSEHHLDGRQYPLEMHIVHKRRNRSQAQINADQIGLSVVGVFFELGISPNDHLTPLTNVLNLIENPGVTQNVTLDNFNLKALMPHIPDYFRYNGSLTTPPCDEVVQWSVMRQPIRVSRKQLEGFRRLRSKVSSGNDTKPILIKENFRPVQPLNGRKVIYYAAYSSAAVSISSNASILLLFGTWFVFVKGSV